MKHTLMACAAAVGLGLTGFAITSSDAAAQGSNGPVDRQNKNCPGGWQNSNGGKSCSPNSGSSPAIYHAPRDQKCAGGYDYDTRGWCVENRMATRNSSSSGSGGRSNAGSAPQPVGVTLAKSNPLQLCPTGYRTSGDNKSCQTIHAGAPAARAKGAGACNAGEIEEFGAWCTSTETTLTVSQMENVTIGDFNRIFTQNGRKEPIPARAAYITPLMELKKAEGGAASAAPGAGAANGQSASAPQAAATPAQADACAAKPKKKGLGRALGGAMGAALGAAVDAAEGC